MTFSFTVNIGNCLTLILFSDVCLQPLMLIVPDVQDVYTPLQTDVVVQLSEVSLNFEIFSLFIFFLVLLISLSDPWLLWVLILSPWKSNEMVGRPNLSSLLDLKLSKTCPLPLFWGVGFYCRSTVKLICLARSSFSYFIFIIFAICRCSLSYWGYSLLG